MDIDSLESLTPANYLSLARRLRNEPIDGRPVKLALLSSNSFSFLEPYVVVECARRGLAAGSPWPVDFGPELSRGFRALKVWALLLEHGTDKLGAAISRNCEQARYLGGKIAESQTFELLAPVTLNIVCFRYVPLTERNENLDELNEQIVVEL